MQVETLSIVVTAAATVATALVAVASLVLGLFNAFADARRRKPHVDVSMCAGYADDQQGGGHEYGSVRVINDGQVAVSVVQIGFYVGKRGNPFSPVENWNDAAQYKRLVVPGDFVEVVLERHVSLPIGQGKPVRAFARIADGTEFCSEPITEQTPGAFAFF